MFMFRKVMLSICKINCAGIQTYISPLFIDEHISEHFLRSKIIYTIENQRYVHEKLKKRHNGYSFGVTKILK